MAPSDQSRKRKRGKPSAADIAKREAEDIASPPAPTATERKRGRKPNAKRAEDNAEIEEVEQPSAPKRRHGQYSNAHSGNNSTVQGMEIHRQRPNAELLAGHESEAEATNASMRRTRERPSVGNEATRSQAEREPEDEDEQPVAKRGRRHRKNAGILADKQSEEKAERENKNRGASGGGRKLSSHSRPSASQNSHRKKARRDDNTQARDMNEKDEISELNFQHMRPVTRQVPRDVIKSKWTPLQTGATTRINDLFHDVARLVTMQIRDEKRRTQAITAIDSVIGRLGSKLKKGMPFPPAAGPHREDEFNFEKVFDTTRALEAQLTPMLHSIELLKAERRVEEQLLADDETNLKALEENAKRAEQGRRESSRRLHPFLQEDTAMKLEELEDETGYLEEKSTPALALNISTDDELAPVVKQLNSHLESLENNLAPVEGLDSAILRTRAAVDDALYKHLDAERHEKVVR